MLTCKKCGAIIDDTANVCPACGNKNLKQKINQKTTDLYIGLTIGFLIICGSLFWFMQINKNSMVISEKNLKDHYPFTVDNLILKCEQKAVWVEKDGKQYPLNQKAYDTLQNYTSTDQILKKDVQETTRLNKLDENITFVPFWDDIDNITKRGEKLCH